MIAPKDEIVLATDRRALSQIIINLTNNAIKFTEKGFVRVEVAKHDGGGAGNIHVSVTDSGVGIKREDQAKLFQAFQQIHSGSKRHFEGTGLGLHLSQKLAALLGGRITCQSEAGSGSRFTLSL